jgi:hypothetical protein
MPEPNKTTPTVADALAKLEQEKSPNPAHLWPALTEPPTSWSGTKGYVWATAFGDVKEAIAAVWTTCLKRHLALQAALPQVFDLPDDSPQAHKGLVITFPHRASLDADITALAQALKKAGYRYGAGKVIQGAERTLSESLSIRFEHSIDMGRDVDEIEHSILYRPSLPFMREQVEAAAKAIREHLEGPPHA